MIPVVSVFDREGLLPQTAQPFEVDLDKLWEHLGVVRTAAELSSTIGRHWPGLARPFAALPLRQELKKHDWNKS